VAVKGLPCIFFVAPVVIFARFAFRCSSDMCHVATDRPKYRIHMCGYYNVFGI
jgi:hypothetical protein